MTLAAVAHPASAAPDTTRKVTVFRGDQIVAEFTTAKCNRPRGDFYARTPRVGGYRMFVAFDGFKGFGRTYDLVNDRNANPYVSISVGEENFSSLFVPPFPVPAFGQVQFSPSGKYMSVGYQPMFNQAADDGLVFAGALKCVYRKRGK